MLLLTKFIAEALRLLQDLSRTNSQQARCTSSVSIMHSRFPATGSRQNSVLSMSTCRMWSSHRSPQHHAGMPCNDTARGCLLFIWYLWTKQKLSWYWQTKMQESLRDRASVIEQLRSGLVDDSKWPIICTSFKPKPSLSHTYTFIVELCNRSVQLVTTDIKDKSWLLLVACIFENCRSFTFPCALSQVGA